MNAPEALSTLLPTDAGPASGKELPHESAVLHVTGEAAFTDDLPELRGTLYAALVTSPVAHGRLLGPHNGVDKAALLREHGVVAVFTAEDIPGENNCGPIVHDDPFLAPDEVNFIGQAVAVVVAREMVYAREAARKAQLRIEALPAVLTIEQALEAQSFVMPSKSLRRGDAAAALAAAPHRLAGSTRTGQQEQFYLEGHITYAVPREDGQLTLYTSSQHPEGNQKEAAAALNLSTKDVEVICRRMGGGFGGKEGNASIFSQSAALAAHRLKKPVKLRVGRDDDMLITGKRHDFRIDYDVGFDDDGRILGLDAMLASRCGYSIDYSGPVNDRALLHIDNTYYLPNLSVVGHRCKTHTQSSTAFRGFGGPQGMFGIETVIDDIARHLGKDPLDVRLRQPLPRQRQRRHAHHALRPDHRGLGGRPGAGRGRGQGRLPRASRPGAGPQRPPHHHQAGHRHHAAEVRHQLHRHPAQPGRRAGQHLQRRLGHGEPRRHRDGPGPEHQDRPAGCRRTGHRDAPRARHRHRHAQGAQCVGHRRQQRLRPERGGHPQRLRATARSPGAGGGSRTGLRT